MKIRPIGGQLLCGETDGRIDKTKVIGMFYEFANVPKK